SWATLQDYTARTGKISGVSTAPRTPEAPEGREPVDRAGRPTAEYVRELLRGVVDPELGADIVELGMVQDVQVSPDGVVSIRIGLTTAGCPLRGQIKKDVNARVGGLPGVTAVETDWTVLSPQERSEA